MVILPGRILEFHMQTWLWSKSEEMSLDCLVLIMTVLKLIFCKSNLPHFYSKDKETSKHFPVPLTQIYRKTRNQVYCWMFHALCPHPEKLMINHWKSRVEIIRVKKTVCPKIYPVSCAICWKMETFFWKSRHKLLPPLHCQQMVDHQSSV